MRPTKVRPISHRLGGTAKGEAGVVMLFVLLVGVLIGVVTVGVMQVISADLATGIRQTSDSWRGRLHGRDNHD